MRLPHGFDRLENRRRPAHRVAQREPDQVGQRATHGILGGREVGEHDRAALDGLSRGRELRQDAEPRPMRNAPRSCNGSVKPI